MSSIAIQIPLRSPPNNRAHLQAIYKFQFLPQFLLSTPKKTFNNDKILHRFVFLSSSQLSQTQKTLKNMRITFINTVGTISFNYILFVVLFLRYKISFCEHKYKYQIQAVKTSLPWVRFKNFFQKSLGNSNTLIKTMESRVKRNSQYY